MTLLYFQMLHIFKPAKVSTYFRSYSTLRQVSQGINTLIGVAVQVRRSRTNCFDRRKRLSVPCK
jgi:hypothetical protein